MFPGHPFLTAAQRFTDEAVLKFHSVDSVYEQRSDGTSVFSVRCHPDEPPSRRGWAKVSFTFDAGAANALRTFRELADHDGLDSWMPDNAPGLDLTVAYHGPALTAYDDPEAAEELLLDIMSGWWTLNIDSGQVLVEHVKRRSSAMQVIAVSPVAWELTARRHDTLELRDMYARDWGAYAAEVRDLVCVLGERLLDIGRPQHNLRDDL